MKYIEEDGGINVQYNLCKILDDKGFNVRIFPSYGIIENKLFNKFYNNDFPVNESVVIYCEGVKGNPLKAKYVVRWVLSEMGKNVPYDFIKTWGKDELVYYFNHERKFEKMKKV